MSSVSRKIIALLVLVSFLAIIFFGFAIMLHGPDGRMPGECPFSAMGASLCPQNTIAVAIHLISTYHAFLNVPVGAGLTALIISMLLAVCVLLAIFVRQLLLEPPVFARVLYYFSPVNSRDRKITRWLSLFENSPSQ